MPPAPTSKLRPHTVDLWSTRAPVPRTRKGSGAGYRVYARTLPTAVLFNLDWGDDLAEVVVCYALVQLTAGWTGADGEMLELRVRALSGFYGMRA